MVSFWFPRKSKKRHPAGDVQRAQASVSVAPSALCPSQVSTPQTDMARREPSSRSVCGLEWVITLETDGKNQKGHQHLKDLNIPKSGSGSGQVRSFHPFVSRNGCKRCFFFFFFCDRQLGQATLITAEPSVKVAAGAWLKGNAGESSHMLTLDLEIGLLFKKPAPSPKFEV